PDRQSLSLLAPRDETQRFLRKTLTKIGKRLRRGRQRISLCDHADAAVAQDVGVLHVGELQCPEAGLEQVAIPCRRRQQIAGKAVKNIVAAFGAIFRGRRAGKAQNAGQNEKPFHFIDTAADDSAVMRPWRSSSSV